MFITINQLTIRKGEEKMWDMIVNIGGNPFFMGFLAINILGIFMLVRNNRKAILYLMLGVLALGIGSVIIYLSHQHWDCVGKIIIFLIIIAISIFVIIIGRNSGKGVMYVVLGIPAFFLCWGLYYVSHEYWFLVSRILIILIFCLSVWLAAVFGIGGMAKALTWLSGTKSYWNQS